MTSEQFVREYLHGILKSRVIVVGFNHHFGFNQEGDYKHLWGWREKYNFEAEEIPEQEVQHETVSSTKIRKAISEGYIQRANAYLDHYYLVMGRPEKYEVPGSSGMPPFVRINISEECKLLPAAGIYAVTVVSDKSSSKGMALIPDNTNQNPEVLVHIIENPDAYTGNNTSVLFHKKIHGAVELEDAGTSFRIGAALNEISELIY